MRQTDSGKSWRLRRKIYRISFFFSDFFFFSITAFRETCKNLFAYFWLDLVLDSIKENLGVFLAFSSFWSNTILVAQLLEEYVGV